jgi:hypothetical protein
VGGDPVLLLGNMVAPSSVRFERQEADPWRVKGDTPRPYPTRRGPSRRPLQQSGRTALKSSLRSRCRLSASHFLVEIDSAPVASARNAAFPCALTDVWLRSRPG